MKTLQEITNEAEKEFEDKFSDMLGLIETQLGVSERENVKGFLKSLISKVATQTKEAIMGNEKDMDLEAINNGYVVRSQMLANYQKFINEKD